MTNKKPAWKFINFSFLTWDLLQQCTVDIAAPTSSLWDDIWFGNYSIVPPPTRIRSPKALVKFLVFSFCSFSLNSTSFSCISSHSLLFFFFLPCPVITCLFPFFSSFHLSSLLHFFATFLPFQPFQPFSTLLILFLSHCSFFVLPLSNLSLSPMLLPSVILSPS